MLFREVMLEDERVLLDAGTHTIDLNITECITELWIKFLCQNGTDGNKENPPVKSVTRIEIVDGGDVIHSLSGPETWAMYRASSDNVPPEYLTAWDNTYPWQWLPIMFGRWYGDTEYAFDPRAYLNPQLKITWNLAAVRAVNAASANVTGSARLTVLARCITDLRNPGKLLASKTIHSWTGGAPGTLRTELPVDWPYRTLLVRSWLTNSKPGVNITNLKLTCDTDKYIIFDLDDEELAAIEASQYDQVIRSQEILADTNDLIDLYMGYCLNVYGNEHDGQQTTGCLQYNNTSAYIQHGGGVDNKGFNLVGKGYMPEDAFVYPFGRRMDDTTWFPASSFRDIRLITTEAVASGNSVAIQQARPQPA